VPQPTLQQSFRLEKVLEPIPPRFRARPARKPRPRVRLELDVLEQRQVPTTATLTARTNPAAPDGIGVGSYNVTIDQQPVPPGSASVVVDINASAGEGISASDTQVTLGFPAGLLTDTGTFTMSDDQTGWQMGMALT
jgi:hypothetical protein